MIVRTIASDSHNLCALIPILLSIHRNILVLTFPTYSSFLLLYFSTGMAEAVTTICSLCVVLCYSKSGAYVIAYKITS